MTAVTSESLAWQDDAGCRDADMYLFFGLDDETPFERGNREAQALKICDGCPVKPQCLAWALSRPQQHGVAGGMGEDERAAHRKYVLRRARRRTP
jgi:WhiB family transcriptional regulator, redox-sensing transcriptional regulator